MKERRLASRHPVDEEIRFNCMTCGTTGDFRAKTSDISSTGMSLETTHPVGSGQLIRIITGSFTGEQKYAAVVWAVQRENRFKAGVEFLDNEAVRDFVWYEEFE